MMKLVKAALLPVVFTLLIFLAPEEAFAQGPKKVVVNLNNQHLYAYEGSTLVYEFLVSSGKWNPTPDGTFYPQRKLFADRMIGGSRTLGTFYDLPNVPYVVYFYQGYSIHGTYWHSNFGHPMSHGCLNLSIPDAKIIYNWIDYSTPIIISGTALAS